MKGSSTMRKQTQNHFLKQACWSPFLHMHTLEGETHKTDYCKNSITKCYDDQEGERKRMMQGATLYFNEQSPCILLICIQAREFQKNISFCFIDYAKAFDYCGSQ